MHIQLPSDLKNRIKSKPRSTTFKALYDLTSSKIAKIDKTSTLDSLLS